MLVLTRRVGESLTIGDGIKVVVMQIKGKQVRLGVQAAQEVKVHRADNLEQQCVACSSCDDKAFPALCHAEDGVYFRCTRCGGTSPRGKNVREAIARWNGVQ